MRSVLELTIFLLHALITNMVTLNSERRILETKFAFGSSSTCAIRHSQMAHELPTGNKTCWLRPLNFTMERFVLFQLSTDGLMLNARFNKRTPNVLHR